MLDEKMIINNPKEVTKTLLKRGFQVDFTEYLKWKTMRNELLKEIESVRAKRNTLSKSIGLYKREKRNTSELFQQIDGLKQSIENSGMKLKQLEDQIETFLLALPNVPDLDIVTGDKDKNIALRYNLDKPVFEFKILDHVELEKKLKLIDYERAAKISGKGTWIYTNFGARLEWALINFFIDEHIKDGYEFMMLPHILNYESGLTAGQFPKFQNDVFWLEGEKPRKFLLPTAETALINLHRNEILSINDLPRKYFGFSPCYRKEAGSYRSEERGTIRGYQFHKVEMVQFTTKEQSDSAFEELCYKAESLMKQLGLHYRVSKLAAGDTSFAMARTYDIEVWLPSIGIYKEVSSVSNSRTFQARRGKIRYRNESNEIEFCNTLNGSGLATSRLLPAILEQNQQADGSVKVPDVLVPYMGGITVLK